MNSVLTSAMQFMSVPTDNPALLKAQHRAISRQMPMMYFILMANTWAVAVTHMSFAPFWLTAVIPSVFTVVCAVRAAHWVKSHKIAPDPETAWHELNRTNRLAAVIAIVFTAWSFTLFPYGDAYTKSHVAFYMAITVIACIFCLMYLRSAAFAVTAIVNGAFIAFFVSTGQPTFIAIAINIVLVCAGMLAILLINYQNFARMIGHRRRRDQSRIGDPQEAGRRHGPGLSLLPAPPGQRNRKSHRALEHPGRSRFRRVIVRNGEPPRTTPPHIRKAASAPPATTPSLRLRAQDS